MNVQSNRLFSEIIPKDLNLVDYATYFPYLKSGNSIKLLPSDHCLYYPLEFETENKRIIKGELNFFNTSFYKNYNSENSIPNNKYKICSELESGNKALIINLLDNCYGHSFLKLLNLYNIYQKYHNQFALIVICPASISHFIPINKFVKIEVNISFNDAMNCYSLKPIIDVVKQSYKTIDFVTLDTYSFYENKKEVISFFPFLPIENKTKPKYITFYYRKDYFRTWSGADQNIRINDFFKQLRNYFDPNIEFVVLGDKDEFVFSKNISDKRTNAFGKEVDHLYNSIFSQSIIVIGLIGSNMLQPSMFCNFTIHLVPRAKATIVAEEFFNIKDCAIQNWFNNIYIFGNNNLSDIKSKDLVEKVVLLYLTFLTKEYKRNSFANTCFDALISQDDYLKSEYEFFNLKMANELKQQVTNEAFKFNLLRYRVYKILKKLGIY